MNENLIKLLACPVSNGKLTWDKQNNRLICKENQLAYPIQNGIPVLLPEAGEKID